MHVAKNLKGNPPTKGLWRIVSRTKVTLDTETHSVDVLEVVEMRRRNWLLQVFASPCTRS
jgi:hypothetical protein